MKRLTKITSIIIISAFLLSSCANDKIPQTDTHAFTDNYTDYSDDTVSVTGRAESEKQTESERTERETEYIKDVELDKYTVEFEMSKTLADAIRKSEGLADDFAFTKDYVSGIFELYLWDGGIDSLVGIDNFTSLIQIYIGPGSITDISQLGELTNLEKISVELNYVKYIPDLSKNVNLRELRLVWNHISDISPVGKLASLEYLAINENLITSLATLKYGSIPDQLSVGGNCIMDYGSITDDAALCRAIEKGSSFKISDAIAANKKAGEIADTISSEYTDKNKQLRAAYEYVIANTVYDTVIGGNQMFGYNGLIEGRGVCLDWAEEFCLICSHLQIECRVVKSDTHAWNAVKLNGQWRLYDALWDCENQSENYEYFGFSTKRSYQVPDHYYDCIRYPFAE